ncbi:MAG: hypothetical protein HOQ07_07075 [Sinomonas sp.]|nr:hypothetical protein [Sinomonas sp.]
MSRQAAELYGPEARIVRAERELDGGLGGFLGRRHIEVTVHVPDDGDRAVVAVEPAVPHVLAGRAAIAALLDEADLIEDALRPTAEPPLSTEAVGFDELLERLRGEMILEARIPALLSAPGDLVLVAGLGEAAFGVARSMAADGSRWELRSAGPESLPGLADFGHPRLGSAPLGVLRDATAARARGVETETAVVVACDLGPVADGLPHLGLAAGLCADQVWLVVDARHKPDETAEWVSAVKSQVPVDALAVLGARETRTAHSVNELGIPVGWVDGSPAPRTVL